MFIRTMLLATLITSTVFDAPHCRKTGQARRVAAMMFFLVFSSWFVFATFSYGSEAGEEMVCLRKPNAEELAIIVRYNKDQSGNRGWVKSVSSSLVDINNDGKKDIVYSDNTRTGSCGYSWAVLLNEGNGKYKQFDIFMCIGECVTFLKEMRNGFRMAKMGDTILGVNGTKTDEGGLYVDIQKERPVEKAKKVGAKKFCGEFVSIDEAAKKIIVKGEINVTFDISKIKKMAMFAIGDKVTVVYIERDGNNVAKAVVKTRKPW